MVFEPLMPVIGPTRDSAQTRQMRKMQQKKVNDDDEKNPATGSPASAGPGTPKVMRKHPISIGDYINPSASSKNLMRQVSGLGMEDPVFRHIHSSMGGDRPDETKDDDEKSNCSNSTAPVQGYHPSNIFDDMSLGDVPDDMKDLVSIMCDKTAAAGDGIDVSYYEELMTTPFVDPNPEIERLGANPNEVLGPQPRSNESLHPKALMASLCSIHHDTVSAGSPQQPSDGFAAPNINRKIRHQLHAHRSSQPPTHSTMNESVKTLQSLDLDGVFGKDRVTGLPNVASLNSSSCSTPSNPHQPEPVRKLPDIPPSHRFSRPNQQLMDITETDGLLGAAAESPRMEGATDLEVVKPAGQNGSANIDRNGKPPQITRTGSYADRAQNRHRIITSTAARSDHMRVVQSINSNEQSASRMPPPIAGKKKQNGAKRRALPTMESIFPMDAQQQSQSALDEPQSSSASSRSSPPIQPDAEQKPISIPENSSKIGQTDGTQSLETTPQKALEENGENNTNQGSSAPKLQVSPTSTAEMTTSPEVESTATSTSTASVIQPVINEVPQAITTANAKPSSILKSGSYVQVPIIMSPRKSASHRSFGGGLLASFRRSSNYGQSQIPPLPTK